MRRNDDAYRKNKIIFKAASFLALLVIFIIYASYNQEYVGASDWYGYYASSLLLKEGRVAMEVGISPSKYPCIAPLSYFVKDGKVLPRYPPGYPLLMALAGFIGLEFYVTPFLGVLSVVLMFLLIKPLTDQWIAAFFALIWAFFPIVVYGSSTVMSDLVAAFFILLSLYLYRREKIIFSAFALAFSLAVRPTNILYCLIFLPVLIKDNRCFLFGRYFVIPTSLYGIYNWLVYGAPWKTGYCDALNLFSSSVFFDHLLFYAKETVIQFTPFLVLLALIASWRKNKDRFFYVSWFLIFLIFYCFWNAGGNSWWWTRFLLPGYPALFFLAALALKDILNFIRLQWKWKYVKHVVSASFALLGFAIIGYFIVYGFNHVDIWDKNKGKLYYNITKAIAKEVPPNSCLGSIEFSGSLRLYANIESFNSEHWNSIYLIANCLERKIPVYLVAEPWNLKRPVIKRLFKLFRLKKVLVLEGWPDFYLYKIKKRNLRAWRIRGLLKPTLL